MMWIRRFVIWLDGRIIGEGVVMSSGKVVIEKNNGEAIEVSPSFEDAQAIYSPARGYKLALEPANY